MRKILFILTFLSATSLADVIGIPSGGGSSSGSGFNTIGAFGSSPDAKGASSSGSTITMQPADATHPGMVSTTTQTIAGNKTLTGVLVNGISPLVSGAPQFQTIVDAQNAMVFFAGSTTGTDGALGMLTLGDIGGTLFDFSADFQGFNSSDNDVAIINFNRQGGAVNIGSGAGTVKLPAYSDGSLSVSSAVVVSSSDGRRKDVQGPFERGVTDLIKINPVMYKWKKDLPEGANGFVHAGFIAQNIEEGVPEAVFEDEDGVKSLEDRAIMALLVNAIKEQALEIKALKEKVGLVEVKAKKVIPRPKIQRNKALDRGPCTVKKCKGKK